MTHQSDDDLKTVLFIAIFIIIILPIFFFVFIKLIPKPGKERFELTSHPCISTQLKLLNRVTNLLENHPNNVGLLQYQWILYHNNLTIDELLIIKKNLTK